MGVEVGFHILRAVKKIIFIFLRSLRLNPKYSTSKFELVWVSEHFDEIFALELFLLIPFTKPVNRYQVENQ